MEAAQKPQTRPLPLVWWSAHKSSLHLYGSFCHGPFIRNRIRRNCRFPTGCDLLPLSALHGKNAPRNRRGALNSFLLTGLTHSAHLLREIQRRAYDRGTSQKAAVFTMSFWKKTIRRSAQSSTVILQTTNCLSQWREVLVKRRPASGRSPPVKRSTAKQRRRCSSGSNHLS